MNMTIAAATVDDAEQILAYYTDLLAEKLAFIMDNPAPTLAEEIEFIEKHDGQRSVLLMARAGERVVGLSGYNIAIHHQHAHVCKLGISVARDFRRCGIGRKLILAGEKWCVSKSIRRLELDMIAGNPAIAFYQALGFEIEGIRRQAIKVGDEFRDQVMMAKSLA
jgi:RimJ/RimL family protein N-acetyltransferase